MPLQSCPVKNTRHRKSEGKARCGNSTVGMGQAGWASWGMHIQKLAEKKGQNGMGKWEGPPQRHRYGEV